MKSDKPKAGLMVSWHTDPERLKNNGCGPHCKEQVGGRERSRKIPEGLQSQLGKDVLNWRIPAKRQPEACSTSR